MKAKTKWLMLIAIGVLIVAGLTFLQNYELVFTGVGKILDLFASLLYGCVIAFIVNLLMKNLEKVVKFGPFKNKKLRRIVCMLLSFIILFGAIAAIVALVWPELKNGIKLLIEKLPSTIEWFIGFATTKLHIPASWLGGLESIGGEEVLSLFMESDFGKDILNTGGAVIGTAFDFVINFVVGLCFSFYLLISKESVIRSLKGLCHSYMKPKSAERLIELSSRMNAIYSKFISGQIIDAVILGTMVTIVLLIFRIPYPLLIGIVVAVTAIIPIVGAFIGGGVGAFILLMVSPKQAIIFLVVFIVLQQIDNHLIYPHVVGKSVGLPPIWIFIAVIVGGNVAGILGMVMMIPVVALIYALHHENVAIMHEHENDGEVAQNEEGNGENICDLEKKEEESSDGDDSSNENE